jgi:hypothetical protein
MPTFEFKLGGVLKIRKKKPKKKLRAKFTVTYERFTITAWSDEMAYTLASDTQVHVKVSYVDANNNPATVDGDVTWESSNPDIVNVIVDPADSTLATVQAIGGTGTAQVTATADADLGTGIRELVTPMDVTVVAGEAMSGTIEPVGSAEPIP